MAWAEAGWVQRLTGRGPSGELIGLCRQVQGEISVPALRGLADIDFPLERGEQTVTVRGVMSQLAWHWTYQSGQIGLIRVLWGSDYTWTMDRRLVAPRP